MSERVRKGHEDGRGREARRARATPDLSLSTSDSPELSPYYDPEPEPDGDAICETCNGSGSTGHWICPNCAGEGVVEVWFEDFEECWDEDE